jgi:16S rRNA G966 N2-methylase RsmD
VSIREAYADDFIMLKIIAYIIKSSRVISPNLVYRNMAFLHKTPSHFFPSAAAALVQRYASGGHVLDPFLGWGGRTLGAICGGAASICGSDLQAESVAGCRRLIQQMSSEIPSEFVNGDFHTYMRSTDRRFDLLITSPPFFDTEDYGEGGHHDMRTWSEHIVQPLVRGSLRVMRSGGYVIIHGQDRDKVPVLATFLTAFNIAGFDKVAEYRYGKTAGQSVLILRRI